MATEPTTPPGRLRLILSGAQRYAGVNGGATAWQALASGLGVYPAEQVEFYRRYSRMSKLPAITRQLFNDPLLAEMKEVALRRLDVVERLLAGIQDLARPATQVLNVLDNAVMDGLDIAHAAIRNAGMADPRVDDEARQVLRDDITALLGEFEDDTELPEGVRTFALNSLRQLLEALDSLDLDGATDVRASVFQTVGEASTRADIAKATKESPRFQRFWQVCGRAALLVGLAANSYSLGHALDAAAVGNPPILQQPPPPALTAGSAPTTQSIPAALPPGNARPSG